MGSAYSDSSHDEVGELHREYTVLAADLSDDRAKRMRCIIERAGVVGGRCPDEWARALFADTAPLSQLT